MNMRLSAQGEMSLNNYEYNDEGDSGGDAEFIHDLVDGESEYEEYAINDEDYKIKTAILRDTMREKLTERECDIITSRKLSESPMTLLEWGKRHNVSCERARQIEQQAMKKLTEYANIAFGDI